MKKSKSPDNPFMSTGISFKEKGLITKACHLQGLDLCIEQKKSNGQTVYLSHYSNPGIDFFTGVLKFLYINRLDIPRLGKSELIHDEFRDRAKGIAYDFAFSKFPISYQYHFEKFAVATFRPFYEEFNPLLEINTSSGVIVIYPRTAQKLITGLPLLYPGYDSFHIAYEEFLREAAKYPEQIVDNIPAIRKEKPKQLEFGFMESLRTG